MASLGDKVKEALTQNASWVPGFIVRQLPFGKYLKTDSRLKLFSPESYEEQYQAHRTSADYSEKIGANPFDTYVKDRMQNMDGFAAIKTPDDKTIGDKLKITPETPEASKQAIRDIQSKMSNLLTLEEPAEGKKTVKGVQTEYENDVKLLNDLINKSNPRYSMEAIASYLQEANGRAQDALKDQQKQELDKLEDLFKNDADFKNNITATFGLTSDTQFEDIQKQMTDTLKKKHEDEREKFGNSASGEVSKIHQQASKERERIAYLATLYYNDARMRDEINKLAEARKAKLQADGVKLDEVSVEFNGGDKPLAIFQGIKVEDLPIIKSITGRDITHNPNGSGFVMELPKFNPLYYQNRHKNIDYDMTSLAQAIHACGHDKITMSVNHKDPDFAIKMGRKAYEASVRAGFPETMPDPSDPSKTVPAIKVKVNGKLMTVDELYTYSAGDRSEKKEQKIMDKLQQVRDEAAANKEKTKNYNENPMTKAQDLKDLKEALAKEKRKAPEKPPEHEAEVENPNTLSVR